MVITDPGTEAPTADYDITLTDADGVDVMGGELADRHTTATEQAVPKIGDTVYGTRFVKGPLIFAITNNSVNDAAGEIFIYIWGGK